MSQYKQAKDDWETHLESCLSQLAQILHIDDVVARIPAKCTQLILVPHRYLHLFPLHALNLGKARICLLDNFPDGIRYAPSCQLLQVSQQERGSIKTQAESKPLFAIQNPTGDLGYTDLEVKAIVGYFNPADILPGEKATKNALDRKAESLLSAHCAHFSCHGEFNFEFPLKSHLRLADRPLTLENIFDLNLPQCRLVTLSACETGLTDFSNTSDEYIGLPSGFLYAGSRSVVSSL